METLKSKLESVKSLNDLNQLINAEEVRTGHSFMGERIVEVGGYEGNVPLIELWGKYISKIEYSSTTLTLQNRVLGIDIGNTLRKIENQTPSIKAPTGLFGMIYRIGVYLRQFIISDGSFYESYYRPNHNNKMLRFTFDEYKEAFKKSPVTVRHDDNLDHKSDVKIKNEFFITEETLRESAQNS